MALQRWKRVRLVEERKNPWWTYRHDELMLPSGKIGEYHYVHVNGSSMIIPVLEDGRIILVNQYRYLCDRESLEFPCGGVKDGSTYESTAKEELAQETGFEFGELTVAGEFNPYNGITDEICRVYLARNLTPVQGIKKDETEEFEHFKLSPMEIEKFITDGRIWDGMTLAAWMLIRHQFLS